MQSFIDHPSQGQLSSALTDGQLHALKAELEEFLAEQRGRLQRSESLFRELVADTSVDAIEREAARRAAGQAYEAIQDANRALDDIANGTYGACARCGRRIPFERLEALPRTRNCVACPQT